MHLDIVRDGDSVVTEYNYTGPIPRVGETVTWPKVGDMRVTGVNYHYSFVGDMRVTGVNYDYSFDDPDLLVSLTVAAEPDAAAATA
jgi:hypothetical protein